MDCADEGYVTGAKDGMIRLWDTDFKPISKIDLTQASDGYQGIAALFTDFYIMFLFTGFGNMYIELYF